MLYYLLFGLVLSAVFAPIIVAEDTLVGPVIGEVKPIIEFAKPTGVSEVSFYIAPRKEDSLVVSTEGETSQTGFRMTRPDGTEVYNVEHLADTKLLSVLHNFRFKDGTLGDIIGSLDENEQLYLYLIHPASLRSLPAREDGEFENNDPEEDRKRAETVESVSSHDLILRSALSNSKAMSAYVSHVTGEGYFFIATKGGIVLQVLLHEDDEFPGKVHASVLRTFKHGARIDTIATDNVAGVLYLGDGSGSLWAYDAEPNDPNPVGILVDKPTPGVTTKLSGRVTGLALYHVDKTHSFLIAYTMKNNQFSVYSVEYSPAATRADRAAALQGTTYTWKAGFKIVANEPLGILAPIKVKGFAVTNVPIGENDALELGTLAVAYKDALNEQSIKLVSWKDVSKAIRMEAESRRSTHNPRNYCVECSPPNCPLVKNCNKRGRCLSTTECACYAGWGGNLCVEFNCNDVHHCGEHGKCVGPNHCVCATGWAGADCSKVQVIPTVETGASGADADDPAIWIHPTDPTKSTILGTTKSHEAGGVRVFSPAGVEMQYNPVGHANSVDVVYEFPFTNRGKTVYGDLAVVGSRETNEVVIFKINQDTGLLEGIVTKDPAGPKQPARIPAGAKIYGSCDYRSHIDGKYYIFVTTKKGEILQHEIYWHENVDIDHEGSDLNGEIRSKLVRRFMIGGKSRGEEMRPSSIVEGCVCDHEMGSAYFSEEAIGIWKYNAEPDSDSDKPVLVDSTDPLNGGHLSADLEGVTIFDAGGGNGYLLASIQGIDGFAVLEREGDNKYLFSFIIGKGEGNIDEVTHTDGIAVTSASLGPGFPNGVFVAHDDINTEVVGTTPHATYKMVPWESIANAPGLPFPLAFNPEWSPRKYFNTPPSLSTEDIIL